MNHKSTLLKAAAVLAAGLAASAAQAQLVINVTGTAGSNKTLWTFSGSATFTGYTSGGSTVIMDDDSGPSWYWDNNAADWLVADISDDDRDFLPGSTVSVTIGSRTELVQMLELDNEGAKDQFGLGKEALTTEWRMYDGDVISWSGSGETDVDITAFYSGTFNFLDYDLDGTLPMVMNINPTSAAVPEPGEWAAMGILGAGLTGLVIRKRRRA